MLDPENQFHIVRADRKLQEGGGVCAFIAKKHRIKVTEVNICKNTDTISFELYNSCNSYRFICVYRPPKYDIAAHEDSFSLAKYIENQTLGHRCPVLL